MSELAAILARRRAKDGTGEEPPKEPAPVVATSASSYTRPSPPKPFQPKTFSHGFPGNTVLTTAAAPEESSPASASAPAEPPLDSPPAPAGSNSDDVSPPLRKTSSKIAALQGNLGAINLNAFRPPPARKSHTVSAMTTEEDYDYESTMKTGVPVPGMSGGIPMIGLTRPGVALPGLASKEAASTESSPAPEPEPVVVSHATMSRVTGPKRRAPTKPKSSPGTNETVSTDAVATNEDDEPLFPPSSSVSAPVDPPSTTIAADDAATATSAPSPSPASTEQRRPSMGLFGALPSQPPSEPSPSKRPSSGPISTSLFGAPSPVEKQSSAGSSLFDAPAYGAATSLFSSERPPSGKSLFAPASPKQLQPSTAAAPAVPHRASATLFGGGDDDESSDEWDDEKPAPKAAPFDGPAKQTPPPPPVATQAPPSSIPKKPASNLFGASDSDSDDDAEGLFGTGLPTK